MQIFPNITAPLVNASLNILKPWIQYFQQFTLPPPNATQQNVGTFVAAEPGFLYVKGATAVTLQRGSLKFDFTGALIVPVSIADSVTTTGSFIPYFIPIYGASTQT